MYNRILDFVESKIDGFERPEIVVDYMNNEFSYGVGVRFNDTITECLKKEGNEDLRDKAYEIMGKMLDLVADVHNRVKIEEKQ